MYVAVRRYEGVTDSQKAAAGMLLIRTQPVCHLARELADAEA